MIKNFEASRRKKEKWRKAAKTINILWYLHGDYYYYTYLYCLDYKEKYELIEPGYLCDRFVELQYCNTAVNDPYYIDHLEVDYYCCVMKYKPFPSQMPSPVPTPHRTEIKTPDPSVIPVTKNNKNNVANLVSFFVLTTLA